MWIQYNISELPIVTIQATNSNRASDEVLTNIGRSQYEVPDDTDIMSTINITTGEIIPPIHKETIQDEEPTD